MFSLLLVGAITKCVFGENYDYDYAAYDYDEDYEYAYDNAEANYDYSYSAYDSAYSNAYDNNDYQNYDELYDKEWENADDLEHQRETTIFDSDDADSAENKAMVDEFNAYFAYEDDLDMSEYYGEYGEYAEYNDENEDEDWSPRRTFRRIGNGFRRFGNTVRRGIRTGLQYVRAGVNGIKGLNTRVPYVPCTKRYGANTKQWMAQRYNQIKNKRINDLWLPGTHDTGAYWFSSTMQEGEDLRATQDKVKKYAGPLFSHTLLGAIIKRFSLTQTGRVYKQLEAGNRFFDIRAGYTSSGSLRGWRMFHGLIGPLVSDMLGDVRNFLRQNTKEIVILEVGHFKPGSVSRGNKDALYRSIKAYLGQYLYNRPSDTSFTWPTVAQMVTTGKRVIVTWEDSGMISNSYPELWKTSKIENTYPATTSVSTAIQKNNAWVTQFNRYYKGKNKSNLFKISWTLTPDGTYIGHNLNSNLLYGLSPNIRRHLMSWFSSKTRSGQQVGNILIYDDFCNIDTAGLLRYAYG